MSQSMTMAYGSGTKTNGHVVSKKVDNGNDVLSTPPPTVEKSKAGFLASTFSTVLRLLLWYSVFVVAFRCPSSSDGLTDSSSSLCKPYLQVRSRISPYLEPSYNAYLKPYVDQTQPLVARFNEQVYVPAADFSNKYYNTYAAKHVDKAQAQVSQQWAANVEPKLDASKKWAAIKYDESVAPHLTKAADLADPHIKHAQEQWNDVYETSLVPLYQRVLPHAEKLYLQGHYFATVVVIPNLQIARLRTSAFLSRQVWPRLVILYGENVEPQVLRITERLGRYKDARKFQATMVELETEASITSAAARASSIASVAASPANTADAALSKPTELSDAEIREKIESDLRAWQERFAKAADTGADDLGDRVREITLRQIRVQAHGVGKALVTELDNTVQASLKDIKSHINTSISKMPEDASNEDEDVVFDDLRAFIKTTGEQIRKKAMAVRSWKQSYDNETATLVQSALDSTLDVIDNIRDLGLQEIGTRWALMEGVTYKDWSKYTDMKKTFDTWREKVEAVALQHKSLEHAKEEGELVQDTAMAKAEGAAKELKRLKDVAKWKVWSHDATEDFSTKEAPSRAAKSIEHVVRKGASAVSSNVASLSEEASELLEEATSSVVSAASALTESAPSSTAKVWGGVMADSTVSKHDAPDYDPYDSWTERIEAMLEGAGDRYAELTAVISEALLSPTSTQGSVEVVTSLAGEQYASALAAASSVLFGTPQPAAESVASVASGNFYAAVTAASYAIYGTPTPVLESLAAQASSAIGGAAVQAQAAYASITAAASLQLASGLSLASEQYTSAKIAIGAQPAPLHQQYMSEAQRRYYEAVGMAHDQYGRFVTAASTAVYGTPTPVWKGYVEDASSKVFGTPAPPYQTALDAVAASYSSALSLASENLVVLKSSVADLLATKKEPAASRMLAQASSSYEAASSRAASMLSAASSSASAAYYATAVPYVESAASKLSEGVYGTEPGYVEQAASKVSEGIYGTEPGYMEHAASKISEGVYGTPAPWNEELASQAAASWSSLVAVASEQIYGTPTPLYESAWYQAGDYAAQATGAAASQYKALESFVSELVIGKEPDFTESVMNQFSNVYYGSWASVTSAVGEAGASASSVASEASASISSVASGVYSAASEKVGDAQSAVESVYSKVTGKDEL